MRRFVLLAVMAWAMVGSGALWAGTNVWTRLGSAGRPVTALAIDPQNPDTVYAATDAGLFKSADRGAGWSAVNPGPPCCILTLVIHPQDPNTLYAVTRLDGRVLKSIDGGTNWSPMNSGLPVDSGGNYRVTSLTIDPQNPSTVYTGNAVVGGGVFKTINGGEGWLPASSGLPDVGVMALAIDSQTPGTLYASTLKSGLFKSTDGAKSWSAVNSGLDTDILRGYNYVSVLAINPQDPNTVYASGHYGGDCEECSNAFFKTTDAGANWTSVGRGLASVTVFALAIDPQNPGTIYAGTSAGVYKSTDAAATWSAAKNRLAGDSNGRVVIPALAIDPQNPDTVYAADNYTGLLKTTDAGASWTAVNPELRSTAPTDLLALRIDPQDPATIYAGTDAGVFKTTDAGANWSAVNAGLPFAPYGHLPVSILALDPQSSGTLYIVDAGWQDIFKSADGGASWAGTLAREPGGLVVRGARLNTNALAIDPRNPRTFYVAGSYIQSGQPSGGIGVIKSTDAGVSWSVMSSGLPAPSSSSFGVVFTSLAIDPQNPGTVYAGTLVQGLFARGNGLFKTTNGGGAWTNAGLAGYSRVDVLAVDPKSQGTVYARAVVFGQTAPVAWLFKTTNGGANWTEVDSGLPGYINALAIDPQNPSTLYAGSGAGVFRSADGGANWAPLNSGLTTLSVNALAIDSQNPSTLYAGTAGGVFAITFAPAVMASNPHRKAAQR
jgi:photosystem II stability/assembly factor-like uncharacterized protein